MRHHMVYASFERRWQLPVYFQLRWKEVIGTLEDTLTMTRLESNNPKGGELSNLESTYIIV